MNGYPAWVSDGSVRKYDRAKVTLMNRNKDLRLQGQPEQPITEEAIKALYKGWGGLILDESTESQDVFADQPRKRGRPAK